MKKNYQKFLIMMMISFVIMYLVMYLNIDRSEHFYLSISRLYMTILMVAPMAVVMLLFMRHMYKNKVKNMTIIFSAALLFSAALFMLRKQIPIGDIQYMKAMIPHHSSAILTSEEAGLRDTAVIRLSKEIIKAQEEEIAKMKSMLSRLEEQ